MHTLLCDFSRVRIHSCDIHSYELSLCGEEQSCWESETPEHLGILVPERDGCLKPRRRECPVTIGLGLTVDHPLSKRLVRISSSVAPLAQQEISSDALIPDAPTAFRGPYFWRSGKSGQVSHLHPARVCTTMG